MRRFLTSLWFSTLFYCMLVLAVLIATQVVPAAAQDAHAIVGAQSADKGNQGLAFLPSELWVHVGDSVLWTFATDEVHTVSFLKPGQIRPPFQVGCPGTGTTPDGSSFDGTACVNSGVLGEGKTYTVRFPTAGNFKLVCLVHAYMTGVVHVLNVSETLPHDQAFYDRQAQNARAELLSDASRLEGRGLAAAERAFGHEGEEGAEEEVQTPKAVTAGIAEVVVTTGGGVDTSSVMRFQRDKIVVHVGDTVEWTNLGSAVNHTVTFGIEPPDPMPPSSGVTVDSDGARHAVIGSPTGNVNSGFLGPAGQDRPGVPQTPLGVTRFRVTFTAPGTFHYICALHDNLGMVGTVIVRPRDDREE
jgi:plastocyanin